MQADLLIKNCQIATMQNGLYKISPHSAIAITGAKITWLGDSSEQIIAKQTLDATGLWLTPGLIDCHTHTVFAGNRCQEFAARIKGASYKEIAAAGGGIQTTVRATRAASLETLCELAEKRVLQMLPQGVTCLEIKSGYGLNRNAEINMLRAARSLQTKLPISISTTFLGAHVVAPEYQGKADAYIDFLCKELLPELVQLALVDQVDAFCESIAFSRAQVERLFIAAKNLNLPLRLHCEQLSDQDGVSLALEYNAVAVDHLEYISDKNIALLGLSQTVAVVLPGAYYFLNETQAPPIAKLRAHGVAMAVATDCNPGTSPLFSILTAMNMSCVLFKLTPEEALAGTTYYAAKALGKLAQIGSIEVGKIADLALWDIQHPDELSYNIGFTPLKYTIKSGEIVARK